MSDELQKAGSTEPDAALQWWHEVEISSALSLRKRKLYMAPILIDLARAFLTIQPPPAPFQRLLGDAGHNKGDRCHPVEDGMTEMLLTIKSFVLSYIEDTVNQTSFLSAREQTVKDLADRIWA